MKLGILGGSFDPLHIGHLILAQQSLEKLDLDKILFVVNNQPPHKNPCFFPASVRYKMVREVLRDSYFEASDIELKRKGISYTIDTLRELKKRYLRTEFYLIIGSDLAKDFFKKWKSAEEILKMCKVCVASRGRKTHRYDERFLYFDIIQIEISSTFIRERIKQNKPINFFVPKEVELIIKEYLKR